MPLVTADFGNGPQQVWQNDDGTYWSAPEGAMDASSVRPDLQAGFNSSNLARLADYYGRAGYQQFTPDQVQAFQATGAKPNADSPNLNPAFGPNLGLYGDSMYGGNNLWYGPQAGPQHTDQNGPGSLQDLIVPGSWAGGEVGQTNLNDMKYGAVVGAMPFVGAGITALGAAAAGAGAVGAGAEGGAAAGAGATGVDASTGLFAGESATSGAAGAGTTGTVSGGAGSASLLGNAGADTLGGETVFPGESATSGAAGADAVPGFDPGGEGMANVPTNSSNTIFPNGMDATDPSILQRAQDMAKQLGITPASALGLLKNALTKGAPAVLGAIGANQQANSLSALAKQYMDLGAPSRARYEASFAPGFTMANDPGYQDALDASSKATLHGLSVQGNPAGSPNAWSQSLADNYAKTAYPALQNFRNTNANAGGIASLQTAAPAAATGAINAQSNIFNAIGAGANDIFNPQPSLAQTLAQYQQLLKSQGSGAVL